MLDWCIGYAAEPQIGIPPRRRSNNRWPCIASKQYADYGPTLAAECLEKEYGVKVSVTTLRHWLLQACLLERRRKRRLHRRRRTRREHLGELVQMDGSFHDWFEGRRGWATMMVMAAGWRAAGVRWPA
jgi:hypothetical protein